MFPEVLPELLSKSSAGSGISTGGKNNPHHLFPGQLTSHTYHLVFNYLKPEKGELPSEDTSPH